MASRSIVTNVTALPYAATVHLTDNGTIRYIGYIVWMVRR